MDRKVLLRCALIVVLILIVVSQSWTVGQDLSAAPNLPVIADNFAQLNFGNVLQHVRDFSNFGSRVTGYDGFFQAADCITSYWKSLGLTVESEPFNVVTPIVEKAIITVQMPNGSRVGMECYPLWPNHVNPCPYQSPQEGDRLIYVPGGLPEDFDNVNATEAFVLMDFNNGWCWKNAATFGAKGVIFLEPDSSTCVEAVQKTFSVPLNFPRLYVRGENASMLKELVMHQGAVKIWVDSRMVWEEKTVSNLVAVVEGSDQTKKNEVVVIGAYYDSWSIVPQLSPGATDSMGIAFLLELSRLFTENRPERTVWLVAFAGHYQGLAGAREFVDSHFSDLSSKIQMMFTLDLASDSDMTGVYATGAMYQYDYPKRFLDNYNKWLNSIWSWIQLIGQQLNQTSHMIDCISWAHPAWVSSSPPFEPFSRYFEAEVFTEACYGGGLGFVTTNAFRIYQYTPFDTYDNIQPENLRRQVIFLGPILCKAASSFEDFGALYPQRADVTGASDHGIVDATLQLARYNRTTNTFSNYANENGLFFVSVGPTMNPVGSVVVAGLRSLTISGSSQSSVVLGVIAGIFAAPQVTASTGGVVASGVVSSSIGFTAVLKPDKQGKIVLKGLRPRTGIDAQGYVLDPDSGNIMCATDTGPFGTLLLKVGTLFGAASSAAAPTLTPGAGGVGYLTGTGAAARAPLSVPGNVYWQVPIINVSSAALIGFLDLWSVGNPQTLSIVLYDFVSHSYLVWRDVLELSPEAMVFAAPNTTVEMKLVGTGGVVAVLNNASEAFPQGQGYKLIQGRTKVLTVFDAAENMFYLTNLRAGFLMSRMSGNPKLALYLDGMYSLKKLADEARQNGQNGKLYSYSIGYWMYAINAYGSSFALIYDVVNTATFFFFLSAAFVIFLERLVLGRVTGIKRMIAIIAFFIMTNLALSQVHPGYVIASNVWMLIDGLSVILFSFLFLYIVLDEFNAAIKSISVSVLGSHRSDIERGSLIISSLSMGVENLKKRPMRTALTLTTIIITVSAMTLFTTMGVMVQSYKTSVGSATYTGILLERSLSQAVSQPISELYLLAVKDIASEGLADFQLNPRAWMYPAGARMLTSWNANYSGIRAILAITPEESKVLEGAKRGMGEPFEPGMTKSIIITDTLAGRLGRELGINVTYGTRINLWGIPVTVRMIIYEDMGKALLSKDFIDLDQNAILPPDTRSAGIGVYSPIDISAVIFVPYDFAREYFKIQPNVISLSTESTNVTELALWQRSFDLVLTLQGFTVAYGVKSENIASKATTRDIYMLSGGENMIVPLLLSSLTLLSMMLSSVYERTREIRTLSTVGLSPRHIGTIFITESIALAFLGSFLGYFSGAGVTALLWNLKLFPPSLIPNVSSGVVIIVMGIMIMATMLSSIYPVSKASKMVTPSLLRKWRIGSKPVGNLWSVGLPFSATPNEAIGVLGFLGEFFEASATERTGLFMLLKPVQLIREDNRRILSTRLQLSPFDAGVIQDFEIICSQMAADKYSFEILIKRVEGLESLWITTNKALLDVIRKQFLIWRALRSNDQQKYIEKAKLTWKSGAA
jgi:ABC-type antimicrobial peptide transport system permease subunit